jgi:hypothetical protein
MRALQVGIDYMSIAAVGELREVHLVLLEKVLIKICMPRRALCSAESRTPSSDALPQSIGPNLRIPMQSRVMVQRSTC